MKVTRHATQRGKERVGVKKSAMARRAALALDRGLPMTAFSGDLRRYLDERVLDGSRADNVRVYGAHIYLFQGDVLLTVLHVPRALHAAARKALVRYRATALPEAG